jgi:hypothetical protein
MPTYTVKDPTSGKTVKLTGETPPTEAELTEIFGKINGAAPAQAPAAPPRTWGDTAADVGTGIVKGATRTAQTLIDDVPHFFGGAGASDYIDLAARRPDGDTYARVQSGAQPTNTPQRIGGAIEGAAEWLAPVSKAAEAVPSTERAGRLFQNVMGAAGHLPVDVNAPGQVALRIGNWRSAAGRCRWPCGSFSTASPIPRRRR